ncbi:hypothetical protein OAP56_00260 [Rickettsiaceae bacterium]|nr:hypothetical protein [Rickettsiaceae bacterium]
MRKTMNFNTNKKIQALSKTRTQMQSQVQTQARNNPLSNIEPLAWLSFGVLMAFCIFPEIALAGALTLEETAGKVDTLANGKLKNAFLSITSIGGIATAAYKGSVEFGLKVVGAVATLAIVLEWINGGMKLGF